MQLPKVSIIIVTYNAALTIQQAINSVSNQSYENKELIIIDGASTDETPQILQKYQSNIQFYLSEPDHGIYDAMNKGIRLATGEWVLFLGSDDLLADNILNRIFQSIIPSKIGMLYGKVCINGGERIQGKETSYQELITNNTPHQGIFYRRSLLLELGGYQLKYPILADYDLNLRIFRSQTERVHYLDHVIADFSSKGVSNRTIDETFFSDKLYSFIHEDQLSPLDSRLGKYYFFLSIASLLKHQYRDGIKMYIRCLRATSSPGYYLLLMGSHLLAQLGIGRKFSIAKRK